MKKYVLGFKDGNNIILYQDTNGPREMTPAEIWCEIGLGSCLCPHDDVWDCEYHNDGKCDKKSGGGLEKVE